jgi:hypothetical protein
VTQFGIPAEARAMLEKAVAALRYVDRSAATKAIIAQLDEKRT